MRWPCLPATGRPATFLCLLVGAPLALWLAWRARRASALYSLFWVAFGIGLFLTAMEEVAWGQWLAILAGFDLHNDFYDIQKNFDHIIHRLSEVAEMMIGISTLLYVWLKLGNRDRSIFGK